MKNFLRFLCALCGLRVESLTRAVNDAAPALQRLVNACNVAFDGKSEWTEIKYGVYPNAVGLQVFDRAAAEAIVSAFNDRANRIAQMFRGEPIYVGHPDDEAWKRANPGIHAQAVGRIREVQATDTGLRLRLAYNDEGTRLVGGDAPAFTSFSPNWGMLPTTHQGRKAFRPVQLLSIGLTNQPNIPGTYIGLNEKLPDETPTENPVMKNYIIALLAALGRPVANAATVTDEQLASAVNEAVPVATKFVADAGQLATAVNEKTTLTAQLTSTQSQAQTAINEAATLRTQLATERTARAGVVITTAINEGRLTEAQRPEWLGKFTAQGADFAAIEGELGKLKKAVNTQSKADVGARRGATTSPEAKQRITAINEAITKKMTAASCDRITAYNALRTEQPELFTNDKSNA
ncbi:MAG: hypothetical protein C0518_05535 [Opitutus sp.]|nr:hypothetical protein [Opitutus sp.]